MKLSAGLSVAAIHYITIVYFCQLTCPAGIGPDLELVCWLHWTVEKGESSMPGKHYTVEQIISKLREAESDV